jgi:hypothetical protein
MEKSRLAAVFLACVSVGWVIGHSRDANATDRRYSASICQNDANIGYPSYNSDVGGSDYWSIGSQSNVQEIVCPIDDDSLFHKTGVATLNVHGYDNSSSQSVLIRICRTYWSSEGGVCSYQTGSGSTPGNYTISLNASGALSIWAASSADFGYIYGDLGNGAVTVRGFFLSS